MTLLWGRRWTRLALEQRDKYRHDGGMAFAHHRAEPSARGP
jgi:hypothetical protein